MLAAWMIKIHDAASEEARSAGNPGRRILFAYDFAVPPKKFSVLLVLGARTRQPGPRGTSREVSPARSHS